MLNLRFTVGHWAVLLLALPGLCFAALGEDLFEEEPIRYSASVAKNPVSDLMDAISSGREALSYDKRHGYLTSVLDYLKIPLESQVLVFSKTSFQRDAISPTSPRALYFNDDVYVGVVPGTGLLEISVADPALGAVFYSLSPGAERKPQIQRQTDKCLQCHGGTMTNDIPGHLVRSVFTDAEGFPILKAGTHVTTQDSPFEERWGGWYVTGTHGTARHMGNVLATETMLGAELDVEAGANRIALDERVNASDYLTPHSDIVALMVLEHQTRMHNLITEANFDTRRALKDQAVMDGILQRPAGGLSDSTRRRIASAGDELVDYMLFSTEAKLESPVSGTSRFTATFAAQGPRDATGRSLRDFDLETRLFKYPLSYLVYSAQFEALPPEMKDYVYLRLWKILNGEMVQGKGFPLSAEQRTAIREILAETKAGLPGYWTAAPAG